MPANRLRTERWRDSLDEIAHKGGGIELAIERRQNPYARKADGPRIEPPRDLLWRVRLLEIDAQALVVESPGTMGTTLRLDPGTPLIGVMAIGQTRWMFHSKVLEAAQPRPAGRLRIAMPEHVERCTRRAQQRTSTAELTLPDVHGWHLRDPQTAPPAEEACRARIAEFALRGPTHDAPLDEPGAIRPDLGAGYRAKLANIGGGGVGLMVDREERGSVEGARLYWLQLDLRPIVPVPLGLTARLAHSHIDALQNLYAGMAFEFTFNPAHKDFVVAQIRRYADHLRDTANAPIDPET